MDAHSPVTITLPSAVGKALAEVVVKEVGGGGQVITIAAQAGQEVDGQAAAQIAGSHSGKRLVSDGESWLVM